MAERRRGVPKGASIGDRGPGILHDPSRGPFWVVLIVLIVLGSYLWFMDPDWPHISLPSLSDESVTAFIAAIGVLAGLWSYQSAGHQRRRAAFTDAYRELAAAWSDLKQRTTIEMAIPRNEEAVRKWIAEEKRELRYRLWDCYKRETDVGGAWNGYVRSGMSIRDLAFEYDQLCRLSLNSAQEKGDGMRMPETLREDRDRAVALDKKKDLFDHLVDKLAEDEIMARPLDPGGAVLWLKKRHHKLIHLNSAIVEILPTDSAIRRINTFAEESSAAVTSWDHALQRLKIQSGSFASVNGMVCRIDSLVGYWLTKASADPLYRSKISSVLDERFDAFRRADNAIVELEREVIHSHGGNKLRPWIIRKILGAQVIETIDRLNREN